MRLRPEHNSSRRHPIRLVSLAVSFALVTLSSGCQTTQGPDGLLKETFANDDPCSNNARNIGIVVGTIGGAILQKLVQGKDSNGAPVVGMAVGALLGGMIGHDMDRRRCELAKVAKANGLDVVMTDIKSATSPGPATSTTPVGAVATTPPQADDRVGMSLTVFDQGVQFASGSDQPTLAAVKAFSEMAAKYKPNVDAGADERTRQAAVLRAQQMRILFVGHTDDTGSSQLNADLSERRARAIAKIFEAQGFASTQIFYQGAGEVYPAADNRTEEGRARNRRVEVVDLSDDRTFSAYLAARTPNVALYRAASARTVAVESAPPKSEGSVPAKTIAKTSVGASSPKSVTESSRKPAAVPTDRIATDRPAAVAGQAEKSARHSNAEELDFGGEPVVGAFRSVDIGKAVHSGFEIISSAYATTEIPVGSCAEDRPRASGDVKSLKDDKAYRTSEYLPGTAQAQWGALLGQHYVGLSNVAVLRDGVKPVTKPTVKIYKDFQNTKKDHADIANVAAVNAYLGDKGLLYRVFPENGPVRCIDMVIARATPNRAPDSNLVYQRNGALYQVSYSPSITR